MAQGLQTSDQRRSMKERLLQALRLSNTPRIRVYHGHGQPESLVMYGHVLRFGPIPRNHYRVSFLRNTLALIRLFMVKPFAFARVELDWKGTRHQAECDADGFFKIEWKDTTGAGPGWHEVTVYALTEGIAPVKGAVYIPFTTQHGFISDIDDTFLISHSANIRKRLQVLLTQNPRSRKPFDDVVQHYQLLAQSQTQPSMPNPFFFVSSSEWNLYDYILEFARVNGLPEGIYLLNALKRITGFLKSGQNNHQTKFTRIIRILEQYPLHVFTLLGDSSQQDAFIYASVVKHFPKRIKAVYIRDVTGKKIIKVKEALAEIEGAGIATCLFTHSREAIEHSVKIGLIDKKLLEAGQANGMLFSDHINITNSYGKELTGPGSKRQTEEAG